MPRNWMPSLVPGGHDQTLYQRMALDGLVAPGNTGGVFSSSLLKAPYLIAILHWGCPVFESVAAVLVVLSIGMLVAHAFDVYRS